MAHQQEDRENNHPAPGHRDDPLNSLILDGRVQIRPTEYYGVPEIVTINLDLMANSLLARLIDVYTNDTHIRNFYVGSGDHVLQQITNDITSLIDFALGQVYNRLRMLLESRAPSIRLRRMNTRCPVPYHQEFPAFITSTLSSIGPCRIIDGPIDTLILYATSTNTMNHFGRENPAAYFEGGYNRLMTALRRANVTMAPFDARAPTGSYFPTILPAFHENTYDVYGTVHPSHYENEDIIRAALVTSNIGIMPFENVGTTIGYVNDKATLDALAAVPAPADIPALQTADSPGRPVAARFRVNYYGIQPAVAAQGETPAQARGTYILGRGSHRYYQCVLANNIGYSEMQVILRNRLMR